MFLDCSPSTNLASKNAATATAAAAAAGCCCSAGAGAGQPRIGCARWAALTELSLTFAAGHASAGSQGTNWEGVGRGLKTVVIAVSWSEGGEVPIETRRSPAKNQHSQPTNVVCLLRGIRG